MRDGARRARNLALARCGGAVCLFLNDDSCAARDLVERHLEFHRRDPAPSAALLGRVVWTHEPRPSPFMDSLLRSGVQFSFNDAAESGGGARFRSGRRRGLRARATVSRRRR